MRLRQAGARRSHATGPTLRQGSLTPTPSIAIICGLMEEKASQPTRVGVRDLEVRCIIGVREREREQEQQVLVDISLAYDAAQAAASDRLQHAVDYSLAASCAKQVLEEGRFELLERACVTVARALLERFPHSDEAEVTVKKPGAIEAARFAYATVCVRRQT